MLMLLQRLTGTHKMLVALILMTAVSCIRFEHVQRSTFLSFRESWIELQCRQGKARKKGARPCMLNGRAHQLIWIALVLLGVSKRIRDAQPAPGPKILGTGWIWRGLKLEDTLISNKTGSTTSLKHQQYILGCSPEFPLPKTVTFIINIKYVGKYTSPMDSKG